MLKGGVNNCIRFSTFAEMKHLYEEAMGRRHCESSFAPLVGLESRVGSRGCDRGRGRPEVGGAEGRGSGWCMAAMDYVGSLQEPASHSFPHLSLATLFPKRLD